jgi:hypothetical protein
LLENATGNDDDSPWVIVTTLNFFDLSASTSWSSLGVSGHADIRTHLGMPPMAALTCVTFAPYVSRLA